MKWTVKRVPTGLKVDFESACGKEQQRLIETLKEWQDGWQGCPPDEVSKISTSTIRATGGAVSLDILALGNSHLDSRKTEQCLKRVLQ